MERMPEKPSLPSILEGLSIEKQPENGKPNLPGVLPMGQLPLRDVGLVPFPGRETYRRPAQNRPVPLIDGQLSLE